MAIAYKSAGAGAGTETSGAALSLACPATVDANDILVAHVIYLDIVTTPSTPAGWTLLDGPANLGTGTAVGRAWAFGKLAAGTEDGAAISFGTSGGTAGRFGRIYSFSGYVSGTLADVIPSASFSDTPTETSIPLPSVTTTVTGALAIALLTQDDNNAFAAAGAVTGGTWTEPVAEFVSTSIGAQGCICGIQTCTPTGDPGSVSGGTANATADEGSTIGFEIRPSAPSSTIVEADGAAAGASTVASVASAIWNTAVAAAGVAAATVVGAALWLTVVGTAGVATGAATAATVQGRVGVSAGAAGCSAEGADGAFGGQGVAAGTSAVLAVGASIAEVGASAAGTTTVLASSAALIPVGGSAVGQATGAAVSSAVSSAVGSSAGISSSSVVTAATARADALSAATAVALADGADGALGGQGSSSGSATVAADGGATAAGVASATGTAAAVASGAAITSVPHILAFLAASPPYYVRAVGPQGNVDLTLLRAHARLFESLTQAESFMAVEYALVSGYGLGREWPVRRIVTGPANFFGCVPVEAD